MINNVILAAKSIREACYLLQMCYFGKFIHFSQIHWLYIACEFEMNCYKHCSDFVISYYGSISFMFCNFASRNSYLNSNISHRLFHRMSGSMFKSLSCSRNSHYHNTNTFILLWKKIYTIEIGIWLGPVSMETLKTS